MKKVEVIVVILLMTGISFVHFSGNVRTPYIVRADNTWTDCSNNNTAWHNDTYLNVTVAAKHARILWYDIQKYTGTKAENDTQGPSAGDTNWVSIRNKMTEIDNATWIRFIINVSSDQGWDNIEYINISGWHDNGTDNLDGTGYNTSGNHGSNRNFFLYYDNTSNVTAYYNISWPVNRIEVTKGNFTETVVTDVLGIVGVTETRNLTFQFKPGYQFRYAPGPDGTGNTWENHSVQNINGIPTGDHFDMNTSCWKAFNNSWSWNFNITVKNAGEGFPEDSFISFVNDEFGVYSYTEIVSVGDAAIYGSPDNQRYTNDNNVTIRTRSNGNYSLVVHVPDLIHVANITTGIPLTQDLTLENDTIYVRGGNRTSVLNFSDGSSRDWINLYGSCNYTTGVSTAYQTHEVNGTCKYTGENESTNYPNYYNATNYGSQNNASHEIEWSCKIPWGQWSGTYTTNVYYRLKTELIT